MIGNNSINGWLNIYKEKGQTSFSISKSLKKKFKLKKIGHLGTLDPLAEGVLPIAIGEATKSINYIKYNKKRYLFTIKWGEETDTCDTEGNVIKRSKKRPSYENIEIIVKRFFKGNIKQTPPQYSAVKINGVRAYKLARENIKVKLKKKEINIFNLSVKKPNNKNFCSFDLWCSSGTYVRSLARDISKKLGTVGHAHEIIRIQDNVFKKTNASYLEKIIKLDITSMKKKLYPVDYVLDNIKIINVEKKYSDMLKNGIIVNSDLINNKIYGETELILIKNNDKLVCIANCKEGNIIPKRNFNL